MDKLTIADENITSLMEVTIRFTETSGWPAKRRSASETTFTNV